MRLLTRVTCSVAGVMLVLSGRVGAEESAVYFATGGSNVKGSSINKAVKAAGSGATWHLVGSTDPRGSEEINNILRASRAESVKRALVAAGVDEANISIEEGRSSDEADSKVYWQLRRVSIRYEGGQASSVATNENPSRVHEPALTASERRKADIQQQKAEAEQKRAQAAIDKAEAKRAEAEQGKKLHPEQKNPEPDQKAEAEQKRAEAEQKRAEAERQKRADSESKKGEAQQKRAMAMVVKPTDPEPRNTTGEKRQLEKIELVYWRALNHSLWVIAKEKGFFEAEGFDVSLRETTEDARVIASHLSSTSLASATGVQSTKALQAGQKRFAAGAVCGFAAHEAMARGAPIVDIGSMIMISETLVMKKELADELDKSLKAFQGKKIADFTSGGGVHLFKYNNILRSYLQKVGLADGKDYVIVEYAEQNQELADLVSQKVDIAKVFPPADVEFVRAHPDYVRVPFAKFFPYLPCCRQMVTRDQLKQNRGKYVRLLRASIRAHQFSVQHPRETAAILGKWLDLSPSLVRQSIMSSYVNLTPDPMRKGVEMFQRTNDKFTGTKTATAEYIDTSLYRDALLGLQSEDDSADSQGYFNTMISRFKANN